MKRIPKNKKYTGKDLATLQLEDMVFQVDQLLQGIKEEDLQHIYNLQALGEVCAAAFERDPGQQDTFNAYCTIAAWAANNYMWLISDREKTAGSIEARYFLILQALESGFAKGVDPEDLLKKTEEAIADYAYYCCYAYVMNDALRTVKDHYEWEDLQLFIVPEDVLQEQTARIQSYAADLRERQPLKEIAPIIEKFCSLLDDLDKKAKKPNTAAGIDRALNVLLEWDSAAQFDGQAVEDAMFASEHRTIAPVSTTRHAPLVPVIKYGFMNDKTAWDMVRTDGKTMEGQSRVFWEIDQAKGGQPALPVYITLIYEGDDIKTSRRLTAFDRDVIDAVSTIFFYWKLKYPLQPLTVTPRHVWRVMNGKQLNDNREKPSSKQEERICQSIDKLRFTKLTINLLLEMKKYGYEIDDERFTEKGGEDYMIEARKTYEKLRNGSTSTRYIISREPILYTYNRVKGHILTVPFDLLDVTGKSQANNSDNLQEFRSYLLRRIKNMITGEADSKFIKLETLYRETGIEAPAVRIKRENYASEEVYKKQIRAEAKKDREKIESILRAWVKKKYITGFAPVKRGRGEIFEYEIWYRLEPKKPTRRAQLTDKS